MATSISEEFINLKEELQKIKAIMVTEEKLIQILREELSVQENKYKNGFEKIQRQIIQIKINNNPGKSPGIDFSDFQFPPSLPYAKPFEPYKKEKEKDKSLIKD